jgi:hypothetical protein
MNNDAMAKVVMIEASWRCFVFGLIGLLPIIGLPFSILALWNGGRARVREKQYWNPAKVYRNWGVICAAIGMVIWVIVGALIIYNATTGGWSSDGGGGGD